MKQFLSLGALATINIAIAFLFQWYTLVKIGSGANTDALFAGTTIPQLVLAVVTGSLMHVLVPLFAGKSPQEQHKDIWTFFFLIFILFSVVSFLLIISASFWVPITVPGFTSATTKLTIDLTKIQILGTVFSAVNGVQWAVYHSRHKFIWAEFTPLISGIVSFLLLVHYLPLYGVHAAAWIGVARIFLQTIFLMPIMKKPALPDFKSPIISQAWLRVRPLLIGSSYYKTDIAIDRFLLSTISAGSLSIYFLAQQIYAALLQVINKSLTAPLVPKLSNFFKHNLIEDFMALYRKKILYVVVIIALSVLTFFICGKSFLHIFFQYGKIQYSDVENLYNILFFLGISYFGSALGQISSSAFYAMGDSVTPTRFGMLTYTVYVPAKILIFNFYGLKGLALSTGAFMMLNFALQHFYLAKKFSFKKKDSNEN